MESLLSIRLRRDDLGSCLSRWDAILANLDATLLETMLRAQLRKVAGMKEDLADYEQCP